MKKIIDTIKKNKKFLISTHVNPDPDALCSELALAGYLKSLGKTVMIINEEDVLDRFYFFPGIKKVRGLKNRKNISYDVAMVVDCGDLNRIGKVQSLLKPERPLINIDHHITNDFFGTLNLVCPKLSSTCEVLFELFKKDKLTFTKDIAFCLYTGIMTDTGSFRYSNTTSRTHEIAGELRKFKFSATAIYQQIYETISLEDSKEFTKVLSRFDILFSGKVICKNLSKKVVAMFSETFDLRDALFRFLRSIQGVEVVVICTEFTRNQSRVNLRSAGNIDVAKIAHHFNGGGHHNASGCQVQGNMKQARAEILKIIEKLL